ncbi:hypothetical protein [Ornithinibacillus sp. 179-J 7C1 HS]|uniref:hypothetical protein n=1 Tax=Ornithinibacillus sp. 179-J 7C1 HS TaxID=3142384 RepID=UPI0039A3057B
MEDTKTTNSQDQADELKTILSELNRHQREVIPDEDHNVDSTNQKDISVLNLPPRKEVHGHKRKRTHLKITKPFLRLAFVVVLLLAVLVILFILGDGMISF